MVLDTLSAGDLARALRAFAEALGMHREAINRLNVYPVPDGDTGTNMALTVEAVVAKLPASEPLWDEVAQAMAQGSLMGARGNSGVILSQVLRGFAAVVGELADAEGLGPAGLARALRRAADEAYLAVSKPVEGTMLTVARAAAVGAEQAMAATLGLAGQGELAGASSEGVPALVEVLKAARAAAKEALAGTTEQLPALRAAGVVDAGGAGLVLFYDALLYCTDGTPMAPPPAEVLSHRATRATRPAEATDLRYEVMFLLEAPDEAMPAFREVWAGTGGSVAIVGGDGLYKCHIHTDDIGAAIEAAIEIGRPRHIRVTDLAEQVEEERWVREAGTEAAGAEDDDGHGEVLETAVVAVCAGEGVKRIFRSLGARRFVVGGGPANPSVGELLDAIAGAPAEGVVVLPNSPNVVPSAEQAVASCGKKARVVPTSGIAEGFAALLAYDPEADVDTNADAMAAAAARVLPGEVARASRSASTEVGMVEEGDWVGLSRQQVKVVVPASQGPAGAAIALVGALVNEEPGCEVLTVIEGEGATPAATRRLVEWVSEHLPGVETEVHHGGQPLYAYVLSLE
jgi:DAK2 domain fusion protein YloV